MDVRSLEFLKDGIVVYDIDIERVRSSAGLLDWFFQIKGYVWVSVKDIADLVAAFDDLFHPQRYLCSNGIGKRIPADFLALRIAETQEAP